MPGDLPAPRVPTVRPPTGPTGPRSLPPPPMGPTPLPPPQALVPPGTAAPIATVLTPLGGQHTEEPPARATMVTPPPIAEIQAAERMGARLAAAASEGAAHDDDEDRPTPIVTPSLDLPPEMRRPSDQIVDDAHELDPTLEHARPRPRASQPPPKSSSPTTLG